MHLPPCEGCATARAQFQRRRGLGRHGARIWAPAPSGSLPSAARNTSVEELSKILSASQLSPANRSFYLSLRAFVFSRMGREADSQKDVAEMGTDQPQGWPVMMW